MTDRSGEQLEHGQYIRAAEQGRIAGESSGRLCEHTQEEVFLYRDTSRLQAGAQMTTVTMARRLPALVLRSLKMAWQVDRVATG